MDLGPAVVADEQALEVVEVGEGAFDHPAHAAETGTMLGLTAGDQRLDAAGSDEAAVGVVVVAAIGDERIRATARPADKAPHGGHLVKQRDQLGDVIAVAARERPGERDPARVDEEVVLGARSGSINRARARLGAPFFACT